MDVTSAINSLGTDYVSKVSQAMQDSATGSTAKTDSRQKLILHWEI